MLGGQYEKLQVNNFYIQQNYATAGEVMRTKTYIQILHWNTYNLLLLAPFFHLPLIG